MTLQILGFLLIGLVGGLMGGLLGLGGGIVIVPALVLGMGFSQQMAQGTTLALMVPPIGIFAAWTYYRQGFVNLPAAVWICLGFIAGSWVGAKVAVDLSEVWLRRIFGVFLLVVAGRILWTAR